MTIQRIIGLSFLIILLQGCATNPSTAIKKAGMRTVLVEPRVDARQGLRYGIDTSSSGNLANVLASIIVDSAGQKGVTRMSAVMEANRIIVSEIVHNRAAEAVRALKDVEISEAAADGVFVISIVQYGFEIPSLRLSERFPFIVLRAELRDRNGKSIWRNQTSHLQLTTEGMGAKYDEYEAQPDKLRADWTKQIDYVLHRLFVIK